jgi:Cell division septal protein
MTTRWMIASMLLAGAFVALSAWVVALVRDPEVLPVRTVRLKGGFEHLTPHELKEAVASEVSGGFFAVDLDRVRAVAETLIWVDTASVRRVWPNIIEIRVVEQVPVARWTDKYLVNRHGKLFGPVGSRTLEGLPQVHGPQGTEHGLVEQLRAMGRALHPVGLTIARLVQDERRSWNLWLENGVEVRLGRSDALARVKRFARAYPHVFASQVDVIRYVDLRYTNGLAVAWKVPARVGAGDGVEG